MGNSVYTVNKGINKAIEFKGLKAHYIWYLGGALVVLLALFAGLYILGVSSYVCIGIILAGGTGAVTYVYRLSNTYGEHGMMKKMAQRSLPEFLASRTRKVFMVPAEKDVKTN